MSLLKLIKDMFRSNTNEDEFDMEDLMIDEDELEDLVEEHLESEMKSDPDFDIPEPPEEPPEDLRPSFNL